MPGTQDAFPLPGSSRQASTSAEGDTVAKKTASKSGSRKSGSAKSSAKKRSTKTSSSRKRSSTKRELIDPGTNKRYAKRTAKGKFKEMDDVSRSLSADTRQKAKTKTRSGYGDQGDRKTSRRRASKKR